MGMIIGVLVIMFLLSRLSKGAIATAIGMLLLIFLAPAIVWISIMFLIAYSGGN
jgi:hypothetical protein